MRPALNIRMFDHLYEDGYLTLQSKIWFLEVVDGHVALVPEQQDDFLHLLSLRGTSEFYADPFEAFVIEFPRTQMAFYEMVQNAG